MICRRLLGCWSVVACVVVAGGLTQGQARADVREGYSAPALVVPYAQDRPKVDGVIDDQEWAQAASVNAMLTTARALSTRATRFWLAWDEENIYVAMRSPLRKGERVIQALRDTGRDINVVFDDSYEIWLDAGTRSRDGQPVLFQFLCNFAGARYDVMHEPAVGNSRLGWTSGWQPANRITPAGDAWEMEVAIPRRSLFIDKALADGSTLRLLIARNFKRPWEQNSFVGSGSFSARETFARLTLSRSAPAVHLLDVADPLGKTFGVEVAARGVKTQELRWSFASDAGVKREGALALEPGKTASAAPGLTLDKPGEGSFRVRVTDSSGKLTLLDWAAMRAFGPAEALTTAIHDDGKQVGMDLVLNPVRDYLRVSGDFIGFDARRDIRRFRIEVLDAAGKTIADKPLEMDTLAYVRASVPLPGLADGSYTARITGLDAAGKAVVQRERAFGKKDPASFSWWKTKLGNIEKVIEPWTPVGVAPGTRGVEAVDVWGRTMRLGEAGLPSSVRSQGRELLAGPVRLELVGEGRKLGVTTTAVATERALPHRATLCAEASAGTIDVRTGVVAEFDGLYKVSMTLSPRVPTSVESIRMVVPVRPEVAQLLHASGQGIRYGFDVMSIQVDRKGRMWDSRRVDGQGMAVGSFIPFVWVGDHKGGLAWFADSDEGWAPSHETPAIELRRDGNRSVDLVFNLVSSPLKLDKPRTIIFAFQATPVKPMHKGWRMDPWWSGDTFRDYQGVEKKGGSLIWTNIPFTLDLAACKAMVDAQRKGNNSYNFGLTKMSAQAVPYLEWNHIAAQFAPEAEYLAEEWKATGSEGGLVFAGTLNDYVVDHIGKWARDAGIDGIYIDNSRPVTCDNLLAGRGYRLPDGRVQPTFQIFSTRELMLRLRAAFAEQGKSGKFVLHMTNNMVIPWVGAADIAYDGEHHVIYPDSGVDFMDVWSLERLRLDVSGQWGVAVNFMHEFQGPWEKERLAKVMRGYMGMMLLHDALPSGNANGVNTVCWIARDRFGIEADDVSFLFYGDADAALRSRSKEVLVSGWRRPGKLLMVVVNRNREEAEAKIEIDASRLGLPSLREAKIWDAETQAPIEGVSGSVLKVKVPARDYRQIVLERR